MAKGPTTYAAWLDLLDRFRAGDDAVLPALEAGTLEWSPGVAERWLQQVSHALEARLQALSAALQKGLDRSRDSHGLENSLLQARRGLAPLARLCALSAMPSETRDHFRVELERWARTTQSSLERQLARLHDQGVLLRAARAVRLEVPGTPAAKAPPPTRAPDAAAPPLPGRRILL